VLQFERSGANFSCGPGDELRLKGYQKLPKVCYGLTLAKRPCTIPCNHRRSTWLMSIIVSKFFCKRKAERERPPELWGLQYRFLVHFLLLYVRPRMRVKILSLRRLSRRGGGALLSNSMFQQFFER
jgi:hypothetical protein